MNQIECIEFASLLGVVISQLGQDGEQKRVRECFHFLFYRKYYFLTKSEIVKNDMDDFF